MNWSNELVEWTGRMTWPSELIEWTGQVNWSSELVKWTDRVNWSSELVEWMDQGTKNEVNYMFFKQPYELNAANRVDII